jgi:hypothetical protein
MGSDKKYLRGDGKEFGTLEEAVADVVYDEAALERFIEAGRKAWAGVPDAVQWVRDLRDGKHVGAAFKAAFGCCLESEDEGRGPSCAACGKAWTEHLGCQPLCEKLQAARAALQKIREAINGTFTLGDIADAVGDGLETSE